MTNNSDKKFLDQCFENAQIDLFSLPRCDDTDKLTIYGLFKQATVGDNNNGEPYSWNLRKKAKWEAWEHYKGMDPQVAKREYCNMVKKLTVKYATYE